MSSSSRYTKVGTHEPVDDEDDIGYEFDIDLEQEQDNSDSPGARR